MDSYLYVERILQLRKAKDSTSVQTLSCPKEAILNPVFLPNAQVSQTYLSRAGSPPARSFKIDNHFFSKLQTKMSTLWYLLGNVSLMMQKF